MNSQRRLDFGELTDKEMDIIIGALNEDESIMLVPTS